MSIDLATIRAAHERIRPYIKRTPVMTNSQLDETSGASLFFKCENLQEIGAFKARGATNAVFSLDEATAQRGVATHSSGNHGTALARAARLRGIRAHIVMPSNTAKIKLRNVERYGARVILCEPNEAAREKALSEVLVQTGSTLIHPFENENVMAGQGTTAVELLEDVPDLDILICPVGGGGLLAGSSLAAKTLKPGLKVIAAEPANVDDASQSFQAGKRIATEKAFTIADGLRTNVGELTFPIIKRYVDDVVTVTEEGIVSAMRTIWETLRVIIEPSSAVAFAALSKINPPSHVSGVAGIAGKRVGIILTGGNVDLDSLPWMKQS